MDKKKNLTQALIERATCTGSSYSFLWDSKQDGLGVKIEPSGHKSFVFLYRHEGKSKRKAFAACNKISLDHARELVKDYAYKAVKGIDPFAKDESKTLYELAEEYLKMRTIGEGRYKKFSANMRESFKYRIKNHLKDDKIGQITIEKLTLADASAYMERLANKPSTANWMRSILLLVVNYSIKKGYREVGTNVWDYVDKYTEKPKRPRLTESNDADQDQPTKLLQYLHQAETGEIKDGLGHRIELSWVYMMLLLYFTGARPDDIRDLKISEIDFENSVIHRSRSKTGAKDIPLSGPSIAILRKAIAGITRDKGNPYVFAGKEGKGYRKAYGGKQWDNLRAATGITAPPYALRRYFALTGKRVQDERGGNMKVVSDLMGHASEAMTNMYAGEDKELAKKEQKILVLEAERVARKLLKNKKTDVSST